MDNPPDEPVNMDVQQGLANPAEAAQLPEAAQQQVPAQPHQWVYSQVRDPVNDEIQGIIGWTPQGGYELSDAEYERQAYSLGKNVAEVRVLHRSHWLESGGFGRFYSHNKNEALWRAALLVDGTMTAGARATALALAKADHDLKRGHWTSGVVTPAQKTFWREMINE